MLVYGYKKCSTVKKSLKYLDEHNIDYKYVDNVENKLTIEQIKTIHEMSNQDIKKLFNTSGIKYRELNLKDKLTEMSLDEKYELLASDGMLVKRPIFMNNGQVRIGFKEEKLGEILWF